MLLAENLQKINQAAIWASHVGEQYIDLIIYVDGNNI